jgi:hypothetical protein
MPTSASGVKYRWNPAFFRELGRQREVGDALYDRAREIVNGAHGYAPHRTGTYDSSLSATKEFGGRGWAAYANAAVPYAWFVEFGTDEWRAAGTEGFAPLRQAAAALGKVR